MNFLTNLLKKFSFGKKNDLECENRNDDQDTDDSMPDILGSIHFNLLGNGEIFIFCDFNTDLRIEQQYGEMLHNITSGEVVSSIISILMGYKEDNPVNAEFIDNVLRAWYKVKMNGSDDPMIRPSNVFKMPSLKDMRLPELYEDD